MQTLVPLHEKPKLSGFKKGDYLVLFGELFQRGYANGLVEEAERRGLTIIRSTVGRRDKDGQLRPLTSDELKLQAGPLINVPLEAGFDLHSDDQGVTPAEMLKEVKLSDWQNFKLDFSRVEQSRRRGIQDFQNRVGKYMQELEAQLEPGRNILFAHLMAGGVPRAKIVMPLMNRTFKGRGDRYLSSKDFWQSDIGRLCQISFQEVTADTFKTMVEASESIRKKVEKSGQRVSYIGYGYHGTEVFIEDRYKWTTYTPYLQGWAKRRLEDHSRQFHSHGLTTCIYNCPEILTNSSSIFQGVEVFLYLLPEALKKEVPTHPRTQRVLAHCQDLLKNEYSLATLTQDLWNYFKDPLITEHSDLKQWPQHSSQAYMEKMLDQSDKMISWHKDEKNLITSELSEVVFEGCGYAMFHDSWQAQEPVRWLGHDIVARCLQDL